MGVSAYPQPHRKSLKTPIGLVRECDYEIYRPTGATNTIKIDLLVSNHSGSVFVEPPPNDTKAETKMEFILHRDGDRIYSLSQAVLLTGFSAGKFRYNKEKLVKAGCRVSEHGWRIPHSALAKLGWLGVKQPKGELSPPSPLELAELRVQQLEREVATLKKELAERPAKKRGLFSR